MSLSMTRSEREAYLSAVHVGVISIERAGRPPLAVPIWYDYDPTIGVWVITGKDSEKGRALGRSRPIRAVRAERGAAALPLCERRGTGHLRAAGASPRTAKSMSDARGVGHQPII